MRQIRWTKSNAVYVPQLDAEHRNIFRLAGELHETVLAGAAPAHVQARARALVSCVDDHFAHEERLMLAMGYSAFNWHKGQHDGVRKRMKEYLDALDAGERDVVIEMLKYLNNWLRDHTALTDRMLSAHLRNYERLHSGTAS